MSDYIYTAEQVKACLKYLPEILNNVKRKDINDYLISSGRKYDGITNNRLTSIMIKSAIHSLPLELRRIVNYRWVLCKSFKETLLALNMTKDQYYYACDKIILCIAYHLNGQSDKYIACIDKTIKTIKRGTI